MNNIQNVIQNLENDLYPYDPDNTWGIAISILPATPLDVFSVSDILYVKIAALLRYDVLWNDPDGPPLPQLIINCVHPSKGWSINLNVFDPMGTPNDDYCVTLNVSKAVIITLLTAFVNNGIPVYDCMENIIL